MTKLTTLVQWFCPHCNHINYDFTGANLIICEKCGKIWNWNDILEYLENDILR